MIKNVIKIKTIRGYRMPIYYEVGGALYFSRKYYSQQYFISRKIYCSNWKNTIEIKRLDNDEVVVILLY